MKEKINEFWILCLNEDGRVVGPPVGDTNWLTGFDKPFKSFEDAETLAEKIVDKKIATRYNIVEVIAHG